MRVDPRYVADRVRLAKLEARLAERAAGGWVAASLSLSDPEAAEVSAKMATMRALAAWRYAWALEHCVEHEDCEANEELATACLAARRGEQL